MTRRVSEPFGSASATWRSLSKPVRNATTTSPNSSRWTGRRFALLTALAATLVTIGGVALLINIYEHKQEARNPFYRVQASGLLILSSLTLKGVASSRAASIDAHPFFRGFR